jgi:hypothetical protein
MPSHLFVATCDYWADIHCRGLLSVGIAYIYLFDFATGKIEMRTVAVRRDFLMLCGRLNRLSRSSSSIRIAEIKELQSPLLELAWSCLACTSALPIKGSVFPRPQRTCFGFGTTVHSAACKFRTLSLYTASGWWMGYGL